MFVHRTVVEQTFHTYRDDLKSPRSHEAAEETLASPLISAKEILDKDCEGPLVSTAVFRIFGGLRYFLLCCWTIEILVAFESTIFFSAGGRRGERCDAIRGLKAVFGLEVILSLAS